jgi:hypothetical protein
MKDIPSQVAQVVMETKEVFAAEEEEPSSRDHEQTSLN